MAEVQRDPREGVLEEADGRWRLRFVRHLRHPREKVWRALTEERHLAAWFPTTIEGELKAGAPLRFRFRGEEFPPVEGRVVACEPPALLEFVWYGPPDGSENDETSRFELEEEEGGCVLTFLTTYDELGKSARDAAGWHHCFDLLEHELSGTAPTVTGPDAFKPLSRKYAAKFGAAAATIGPPPERSEYR